MSYPAKPQHWARPEFKCYDDIIWYNATYEGGCLRIEARCSNRDAESNDAGNLKQLQESPILDIRLQQGMCIVKVLSNSTVDRLDTESIWKYMDENGPGKVEIVSVKLVYGDIDYANVVTISLRDSDK
jgi:hypothetical protein